MDELPITPMISLTAQIREQFKEWLNYDKEYQPKTIESHMGFYSVMSQYLKDEPFTLQSAKDFQRHLKKDGYSSNTRSSVAYTIRILSRFLSGKYAWFTDFSKEISHIKRDRPVIEVLTNDEITRVLTVKRTYKIKGKEQFWFLLLSLLARTGRRVTEIARLQIQDINFEESSILIRKPKNKHPKWIPIPIDLCKLLEAYCKNKRRVYVFEVKWGGQSAPVSDTAIRKELYTRQRLAGINKKCNPHKFRHSFPAELFRRRIPLPIVADLLGHENWKTTEIYTHLLLDDLRSASNTHTLNQNFADPKQVINQFMENIKQFPFENNKQFDYIKVKQAIDDLTTRLYQAIIEEPSKSY